MRMSATVRNAYGKVDRQTNRRGLPSQEKVYMKIDKPLIALTAFIFLGIFGTEAQISNTHGQKGPIKTKESFVFATKKNANLRCPLRWTFGRRQQTGWYLYVPLIQHTLRTESAPNTMEFASSVYRWQKRNRIFPSGIVNKHTLYSFIKHWQSKRIKRINNASESQLLTAPIVNFYDPTRDRKLLKVQKVAFAAYKAMVSAAEKEKVLGVSGSKGAILQNGKFLKIVSSYRSPAYQASLRKKEPNASRAQIAFRSPHFTGRALDLYVGGEPVTTKDFNRAIQIRTPAYRWLVKNAEKFGFYPYFYEPWHWEYVGMKVKSEKPN